MEVLRYDQKQKFPLYWLPYNVYAITTDNFHKNIICMDTTTDTNWLLSWPAMSLLFQLPSIFCITCNSVRFQVNMDQRKLCGPVRKSKTS